MEKDEFDGDPQVKDLVREYDLMLCDECQYGATPQLERVLRTVSATGIRPERHPKARRRTEGDTVYALRLHTLRNRSEGSVGRSGLLVPSAAPVHVNPPAQHRGGILLQPDPRRALHQRCQEPVHRRRYDPGAEAGTHVPCGHQAQGSRSPSDKRTGATRAHRLPADGRGYHPRRRNAACKP